MIFVGSWDRQVRAIDLETGLVDRAFVASKEAIKTLFIYDEWLFVTGNDPVIRAYDLESGKKKIYEGHLSWVSSLTAYVTHDKQGNVLNKWLISGSDDSTIRIWDMDSCKRLETLKEHTNGITCMTVRKKHLYSGSYDHFILLWDMKLIERRIAEMIQMEKEELLSRKFEEYNRFLEAKFGKRKPKKGKAAKGKKGKK